MHIKIYFDNKPLFLCDVINGELQPYFHHDDAVFIDEFSTRAVNAMIHEMRSQQVHAGIFLHAPLDALKKAFWKKFAVIQAAGGVVLNENDEILFIFRRGKWDLPKGKLDPGESLEACAVREVTEETGLQKIVLKEFLLTTFHTYEENGKHILKESHWFVMRVTGEQQLLPQIAEDILEAKWVKQESVPEVLANTFPSIKDVMEKFGV